MKDFFAVTKFLSFAWTLKLILPSISSIVSISLWDVPRTSAAEASDSRQPSKIIFRLPPKGAPGSRGDIGARDNCPQAIKGMTALVPANNAGQTLLDRPSFWFYIPYVQTRDSQIIFELQDAKQSSQTIAINFQKTPGVVQIPFPKKFSPLKSGQRYRWKLTYKCSQSIGSNFKVVEGAIDKVIQSDNIEENLKRANSIYHKAKVYADNGIWFDLLDLISKKELNPSAQEEQKKILHELFNQSPEIDLGNFVQDFYSISLPR